MREFVISKECLDWVAQECNLRYTNDPKVSLHEIVRCKDCMHNSAPDKEKGTHCECFQAWIGMPDFFCAWGAKDEQIAIEDKTEWSKRCITCDAYGYKTKNDYKYGRKYCFVNKVYINKPDELVCSHWLPTD